MFTMIIITIVVLVYKKVLQHCRYLCSCKIIKPVVIMKISDKGREIHCPFVIKFLPYSRQIHKMT